MEARMVVIEEHERTDLSLAWRLIIDPTQKTLDEVICKSVDGPEYT